MKFTLRQKLFSVFAILLLIAAFIGVQSMRRFGQLGKSIDVILKENYRSVTACEQMKDAMERIDSGVLFLLLGYETEGKAQITANLTRFKHALESELNNLTLPDEPAKALQLQVLFNQYNEMLSLFTGKNSPALRDKYFNSILPLFLNIKNTANDILLMNQENMNEASGRARVKAARARRDMYLFLLSSSVIAIIFMLFSNRWILRPIQSLIRSTNEIRSGNLNLVVKVETQDEIGQLSMAFNAMATNLRLFRRSDHYRFLRIQRFTQEAFKNLPQAIAMINLNGTVEVATDSAQALFGLVPNTRIWDMPFPWLPNLYRDIVKNINLPDQKEYRYDVIQHFTNNQERFFQPRAYPIFDNERELGGLILILEDVTSVRQSDEIKKNLFSTISHQLKTPLTSIRMVLHLLLEEKIGSLNEKQADLLVSARDESERLYGIIEDLLDISRIESGNVRMNLAVVSPYELAEEAVAPFYREAQDKGIQLEVDLPKDLPEVFADRLRIAHVFANLLSNAIKYTPFGGRVLVTAKLNGEKVAFSVADTGRGIPKKYQAKVFEKFFRIPGQSSEGGEGLGLAIAREIIRAHRGQISFTSAEGQGTTFTFTLEQPENFAKVGKDA